VTYIRELTLNRISEESVKVRAEELSEATRRFLHRRFGEAASFQTAEELLTGHNSGPPVSPRAVPFVEVCEACERLRFESDSGSLGELSTLIAHAEAGLRELQYSNQTI